MDTAEKLNDLYSDPRTCASMIGLSYIEPESEGITRTKHGKGYTYTEKQTGKAVLAPTKKWIEALVIPPAWNDVWICPDKNGHVLATGVDEKGRKQYIYNPKWRVSRDLIKFYRMILFAKGLPKIRRFIAQHLETSGFGKDKIIATMLWILDNAYIRVGNEVYFQESQSVGLTTLTDRNCIIAGPVVTLAFKGKSGKDQQITFEHDAIAKTLRELSAVRGARLFRYQDDDLRWQDATSEDINSYLHDVTGLLISAKDFRTWGGTLLAFTFLVEQEESKKALKTEKAIVGAVDQAAAILGNTRTVARSSYVHPDILSVYASKNFTDYYVPAIEQKKIPLLDKNESTLVRFLEAMFEQEFQLLQQKKA